MELPIAELRTAQSRLDVAMNRIEEIIAQVHKLRIDEANLADVRSKLEFLQDDLIKRQKLVGAIVKQIKKMKKFRGTGKKEMSKAYEKLQAYETEVTVLSKIQNDIAMIGNKDFAEFRRLMNPTAALRDLFTGIAILFKVPKWKRWPNVQSFIAKSSTKDKILALRPAHLDAKTIKRVRKFLNEHEDTVNRLAAYKANRKIAPLEPWLRTMVALAEKIVIYGLAPETLQEELQKMQLEIKSVNRLSQTVARAKAKEKEIVHAFRTIFRAKGENFEGYRTLSDFLGEEVEEEDSDFDIGDESEELKDGSFPVAEFSSTKDKGSHLVGLDLSIGVSTSNVPSESGVDVEPQRAAKGSGSMEETNNPALKKKKIRSTRVLSYFSGPSNNIQGKGRREQGAKHQNIMKGLGSKERRKKDDVQLPDLGDLLEDNSKASSKPLKGRKMKANKDVKERNLLSSRNRMQPNLSTSEKLEIDLLEPQGNIYEPGLTLDDDPVPSNLSISLMQGNNFTDSKYEEEEDDMSLSRDGSASVKEDLSPNAPALCLSTAHVSTEDIWVSDGFEGKAKDKSDNENKSQAKLSRSRNLNNAQFVDLAMKKKSAKAPGNSRSAKNLKTKSAIPKTLKVATDKAISSHDGSKHLSMSSMATSASSGSDMHGLGTSKGKITDGNKSVHAYQSPSELSLTIAKGTNNQASGNFSHGASRAARKTNSSRDVGNTTSAVPPISSQKISAPGTAEDLENRAANELGISINHIRSTEHNNGESLLERTKDDEAKNQTRGDANRDSVIVAKSLERDEKLEEIDPKLLETLALKMRKSLRELNVDGLNLNENDKKDTDVFKDLILRYNRYKRNSINYDTDIFDIWKGMGFQFKSFKKVDTIEKPEKEIGYHVEEDTPWLDTVQKMRTQRASSLDTLENQVEAGKLRCNTIR